MRAGHLSTLYHASFVLMASPDLERDLGEPCEWTLFGTGPAMVRAFERGELDAGYMGLPPAIIGIARGAPLKCVAASHVEGTVMVSRGPEPAGPPGDAGVERVLKHFTGKIIGTTSKGSIHDVILTHYLNRFDLAGAIDVMHHDQAESIALNLARGTIDAGVGTPALLVFAQTLGPAELAIPPAWLWPGNPSCGVFVHETFARSRPAATRVFLEHHERATRAIRERPAEVARRVASVVKVAGAPFIETVMGISPGYLSTITPAFVGATMAFARELHALGYVDRVLDTRDIFLDTTQGARHV